MNKIKQLMGLFEKKFEYDLKTQITPIKTEKVKVKNKRVQINNKIVVETIDTEYIISINEVKDIALYPNQSYISDSTKYLITVNNKLFKFYEKEYIKQGYISQLTDLEKATTIYNALVGKYQSLNDVADFDFIMASSYLKDKYVLETKEFKVKK